MKRLWGAVRIGGFLVFLWGVLFFVTRTVEDKTSISRLQPLYDRAEQIDVLFTGDSQIINGVYPMELWQDYGIAAYNASSYNQTVPLAYWSLKNLLQWVHPKVVVVSAADFEGDNLLPGNSETTHVAFDGLPTTPMKLRALWDLMGNSKQMADGLGMSYGELLPEYVATLAKYHSRWNKLTENDFSTEYNQQLGAEMFIRIQDPGGHDLIGENELAENRPVSLFYLQKIIDLCREEGVGLVLTFIAHPSSAATQRYANTVRVLAEEQGVPFLDFIRMDSVVDYLVDCADTNVHLNPSGAAKTTHFLGRYLSEHFSLPDRRGDAAYATWQEDYDAFADLKIERMGEQTDMELVLSMLHDRHFSVVMAMRPGFNYRGERTMALLQNVARQNVFEEDLGAMRSDELFPLEEMDFAAEEGEGYLVVVDRWYDEAMEQTGGGALTCETSFGTLACWLDEDECHMSVTRDGETRTFFDDAESARGSLHLLVIDERTGDPVLALHGEPSET